MTIVAGTDGLSRAAAAEESIRVRSQFTSDERAACQAIVVGDVVVTTSYW